MSGLSGIDIYEAIDVLSQKLIFDKGIVGFSHNSSKLIVYVESKADASRIARVFAGHPVEVRVVGRVYALSVGLHPSRAFTVSKTSRVRPAIGGVSIGHVNVTAGTMALAVRSGGKRYILSNNHIICNSNNYSIGDPVLQPARFDGGDPSRDVIGYVYKCIDIDFESRNTVDAGLAEPVSDDAVEDGILDIGRPSLIDEPVNGSTVFKSGRTSCRTSGRVFDVNAVMKVCYDIECSLRAVFDDQILITQPFASPGDSGSAVVDSRGRLVGLLFAGSQYVAVANKMTNVASALGIDSAMPDVSERSTLRSLAGVALSAIAVALAVR